MGSRADEVQFQVIGGDTMKDVYTIIEGGKEGTRKDDFWVRVGVAFENKDGSINVKLNALPEPSLDFF
jgi:hypothetical protein